MSIPTDRLYNYTAHVVRNIALTPRMCRISLTCPEFSQFHAENGLNIKLYFPLPDGGRTSRAYTVRRFDSATLTLDIDFLLHEPDGAASLWARHAQPGDRLDIMGPRGRLDIDDEKKLLLLADLCALPALSAILEKLPEEVTGQALIAVPDEAEIISLQHPAGVSVKWIVDPAYDALLPALTDLPVDSWQDAFLWVAAESSVVKRVREVFIAAGRRSRQGTSMVGYWKRGLAEPDYHDERHDEMDAP